MARKLLFRCVAFCASTLLPGAAALAQSGVSGWGVQSFHSEWSHESFVSISAGVNHTVACRSDGTIAIWGFGDHGQSPTPTLPPGVTFTKVAAGGMSNVGLCSDGTAIVWGTDLAPAPAPSQGTSFVDVTTSSLWFYPPWGYYTKPHGLALRNDGQVVAWGNNAFGQCDVPTLPTGLSYIGIAEGSYHSLALRSDGLVVAWGLGGAQLLVPQLPPGVSYLQVAASDAHSLARCSDGSVLAWGSNLFGQLNVPVLPPGSHIRGYRCGSATLLGPFERREHRGLGR
ncbi:MAG: hypothetical protein IPJ19_02360 [Planctomycetes bacterium]|nr:hypothetical protein [Planctomycetota bacterium]